MITLSISLVRSTALGFLQDNRRINVMLTRCKKGMVLCTSRKFLEGLAAGFSRWQTPEIALYYGLVGRQTSTI